MVIVISKNSATRSLSKIISLRVRYMLWPDLKHKPIKNNITIYKLSRKKHYSLFRRRRLFR